RELLYPQFYEEVSFTDEELTTQVSIGKSPETEDGLKISSAIKKVALEKASVESPCSFTAFEGDAWGKKIKIKIVEKEENSKLLGPAALNEIYVHEGGVYGIPKDTSKLKESAKEVQDNGVKLDWGFLEAITDFFATEIEGKVGAGEKAGFIQIKMAKTPADVNIKVSESARRFIEGKNKPISIKGPVFTAVEFSIS
ncbi:MAG: O-phosphoserine--tRNA ligase, partial [Methanobacteriota archaeon]